MWRYRTLRLSPHKRRTAYENAHTGVKDDTHVEAHAALEGQANLMAGKLARLVALQIRHRSRLRLGRFNRGARGACPFSLPSTACFRDDHTTARTVDVDWVERCRSIHPWQWVRACSPRQIRIRVFIRILIRSVTIRGKPRRLGVGEYRHNLMLAV